MDLVTVVEHGLNPGDVVKVERWGGFYYHYGVYYGIGKVFHCSAEVADGVYIGASIGGTSGPCMAELVPLNTFTYYKHSKLLVERRTQFVNRDRVNHMLGEFKYNILTNNCEHLANYITDDLSRSNQLTSLFIGGTNTAGIIAACVLTGSPWALTLIPAALVAHYGVAKVISGQSIDTHTIYNSKKICDAEIDYKNNYDPADGSRELITSMTTD